MPGWWSLSLERGTRPPLGLIMVVYDGNERYDLTEYIACIWGYDVCIEN